MKTRTKRQYASAAGSILVLLNVLAYTFRGLMFQRLYKGHVGVLAISAELGFVTICTAIVLLLIGSPGKWRWALTLVGFAVGYLWFSSIAWLVMVK